MHGKRRWWTEQEIDYLTYNWGVAPIEYIARALNRTAKSVATKAYKCKLGSASDGSEYLGAQQIADMLGVKWTTIYLRWVGKYGLKVTPKSLHFKRKNRIKLSDLLEWLEKNQDKWNSNRVELYALGTEPQWLTEKRKRDVNLPAMSHKRWTVADRRKAENLFRLGIPVREIAMRLGRSKRSVYLQLYYTGNSFKKGVLLSEGGTSRNA